MQSPRYLKRSLTLAALLALSLAVHGSARPVDPGRQVNVNTAGAAQLRLLPGIGRQLAKAIIAGRPYASPAELLQVRGIGERRYAAIAPFVAVSGPTTATGKIRKGGR